MSDREIFWRSIYTRVGNLSTDRAETAFIEFLFRLERLSKDGRPFIADEVELALESAVVQEESNQARGN